MDEQYIREGIRLANSAQEQAIRIRKAEEYSASCVVTPNWEAIGGLITTIVVIAAWASIFAHML